MNANPIAGGINDSTVKIIAEIMITKTLLDRLNKHNENMKLELSGGYHVYKSNGNSGCDAVGAAKRFEASHVG